MICPYCGKAPHEIDEYSEMAELYEMNAAEYVRMDEGTYHIQTDLFCCTSCYVKIGLPLITDLIKAFKDYRKNVVSL